MGIPTMTSETPKKVYVYINMIIWQSSVLETNNTSHLRSHFCFSTFFNAGFMTIFKAFELNVFAWAQKKSWEIPREIPIDGGVDVIYHQ